MGRLFISKKSTHDKLKDVFVHFENYLQEKDRGRFSQIVPGRRIPVCYLVVFPSWAFNPQVMSPLDLVQYQAKIAGGGPGASHCQPGSDCLKVFFGWLKKQDMIRDNPVIVPSQ